MKKLHILVIPGLLLCAVGCSPPPKLQTTACKGGDASLRCRDTSDQVIDADLPTADEGSTTPPSSPKPNPPGPAPSNPGAGNPKPIEAIPTQNPIPLPVEASAEVTSPACADGETWSFGNYPNAWDISKTGRIKDALPNEKVTQDAEKGPILQVKYGKGTTSPSASRTRGLIPGGTQFVPNMKASYDHSVMSYWLKIPSDFDCVKGGKLPGVASNIELISGGETVDGTNGFSVRLMWRENCTAEVYAYLPRDANQHLTSKYKDTLTQNPTTKIIYGWSIGRGEFSLPKGAWTKVDVSVKVNEVGKQDGIIKVALNGKQVFERKEVVFRTNDKLKTGALFFSTFFGGSDETYAAQKDETLSFGEIAVCPLP